MKFQSFSLLAVSALFPGLISAHPSPHDYGGVLYFQDNNSTGNNVIAIQAPSSRGRQFHSSSPVLTSTDGTGLGAAFKGKTQDSVVVSGNLLFVTNAGSNTLSLFSISEYDPLHPRLIGEPVDTIGEVPGTVAYSPQLRTACVLNSGPAVAGVACFAVDAKHGLTALDSEVRPIDTNGVNYQGADILFDPTGSSYLVAIVKGVVGTELGYAYIYPITKGSVSDSAVVSRLPDSYVSFGSRFLGTRNQIFISNGTTGGTVVQVEQDLSAKTIADVAVPSLLASCWAAYDPEYDTAYFVDAQSPRFLVMDAEDLSVAGVIEFSAPAADPASLDTVVADNSLFALSKTGVVRQIQLRDAGIEGVLVASLNQPQSNSSIGLAWWGYGYGK